MRQLSVRRPLIALLAISSTALAQPAPEAPPNTSPGSPSTAAGTGSSEWAPTPQPQPVQPQQVQPQPAQLQSTAPGTQVPYQSPAATPPPNTYAQPYAPVAANGGARDANNQNNRASSTDPYGGNEEPNSKFEMPAWSARIDPFNWLLAGRLGIELESQVWKFVSVELVPVFIVNDQPPYLNLGFVGVPNTLRQKSAGVGALAGTSVGVGFWLNGKPMEGYVLRAEIANYSVDYNTSIDHVNYIEREFQVLLGQHSKWGPFTIAGTFGFGYMLNKHERCFSNDSVGSAQTSGCPNNKQMLLAVTNSDALNPLGVINLNSWAYPVDLILRISLGVAF